MAVGDLFELAKAVRERAHAPYSKFKVGAVVRGASGELYVGCNVENASYPEGWCAETSAIAALVAAGESQIIEVLVIGDGEGLCTPCGGCRQRLSEFANPGTPIHIANPEGIQATFRLADLLPHDFELDTPQ